MYYIKQLPDSSFFGGRKFFGARLERILLKEQYDNIKVTGEAKIYMNAYLPNLSFYLNTTSIFGDFNNIPLFITDKISEYDYESQTYYYIFKCPFQFSINLNSWSQFNYEIEIIRSKFDFYISFNQDIISEFKIDITTEKLQEFLDETRRWVWHRDFIYGNCFKINGSWAEINIDRLTEAPMYKLSWESGVKRDSILKTFGTIKHEYGFIIKKYSFRIKYPCKQEIKTQEIELDIRKIIDKIEIFNISNWYFYNNQSKVFDVKPNYYNGLYCIDAMKLKIELVMDVVVHDLNRKIIINNNLEYSNDLKNNFNHFSKKKLDGVFNSEHSLINE